MERRAGSRCRSEESPYSHALFPLVRGEGGIPAALRLDSPVFGAVRYPATVARAGSDHAPRAPRGVSHAPRYQMSLPTHSLGKSQMQDRRPASHPTPTKSPAG